MVDCFGAVDWRLHVPGPVLALLLCAFLDPVLRGLFCGVDEQFFVGLICPLSRPSVFIAYTINKRQNFFGCVLKVIFCAPGIVFPARLVFFQFIVLVLVCPLISRTCINLNCFDTKTTMTEFLLLILIDVSPHRMNMTFRLPLKR